MTSCVDPAKLPQLIAAMLEPEFYPHRPPSVELVQTHISYVLLAGTEVYKVKKPVRFTFLDFSTLERRKEFCHEEVRLNRRLAPDMYQGVVSICRSREGFFLGCADEDRAVEYAVRMRRLPEGRTLDVLLERGEATVAMMDRLAERIAAFHAAAAHDDEVTANGAPEAVARVLQENFEGVAPFRDHTIAAEDDDVIQEFAGDFLRDHASLFRRRQEQRRIRDGHGDLHSEHICFTPNGELLIYDCIEFSTRFRYCDVAADIAFLVMDLTYHGRKDLAERFTEHYVHLAGDIELRELLPFYCCYRAYVRGKVGSLTAADPNLSQAERSRARDDARRHFDLAYRYTWSRRPALIVVLGLSGTGKSTIARALQARTGFEVFTSDVLRKEMAGLAPTDRGTDVPGLYSGAFSARVYEELFARARGELAAGRGVILDATFQQRSGRIQARELAERAGVPFLIVECVCAPEEVRRRIESRQRLGGDASDADWAVYLQQMARFEPREDHEGHAFVLDTTKGQTETRAIERAFLRGRYSQAQAPAPR